MNSPPLYTWTSPQGTQLWVSHTAPKCTEAQSLSAHTFLPWLKQSQISLDYIDKKNVQILLKHLQNQTHCPPLCLAYSLSKQWWIKLIGHNMDSLNLEQAASLLPSYENTLQLCEDLAHSPLDECPLQGQSIYLDSQQTLSLHLVGSAFDLWGHILPMLNTTELPVAENWHIQGKSQHLWHLKPSKPGFLSTSVHRHLHILEVFQRNPLNTHLYALLFPLINTDALKDALLHSHQLKDLQGAGFELESWLNQMSGHICLLRQGVLPTPPKNEIINLNPKLTQLQLSEDTLAAVNLKDFCSYKELGANEWIASHSPAQKGSEGIDLEGKILSSAPPDQASLQIFGDFKMIQDQDGTRHYFSRDTCVAQKNGQELWIRPELWIRGDVGPSTGNIRYNKDIVIQGTILTGYTVECGAHLILEQTPSPGSIIHSKGNLTCKQGILGSQTQVLCEGDFQCEFVEDATVIAYGHLVVKHYALNAQLLARGLVQICGIGPLQAEKGAMMGGMANGAQGLWLHSISAEIGCAQAIAGISIEVQRHLENTHKRLSELGRKIAQLSLEIKNIQGSTDRRDQIYLQNISDHITSLSKLKDKLAFKLKELEAECTQHSHPDASIVIQSKIHPNCELQVDGISTIFRHSRIPPCSVAFKIHRNYLIEYPEPDLIQAPIPLRK